MKYLNNKGSSMIIVLVSATIFLGLLAFVTDAGTMYLEKSKLQNAVDAAALAGAGSFHAGEAAMVSEAYNKAAQNGVGFSDVSVEITENDKKITVAAHKNVKLYFARIFSMTDAVINTKATALAGPIVAAKGIKPLGIEQQNFQYGVSYTLKHGAGDGVSGNYGALALGGSGASNYKYNLINGYSGDLEIGELVKIGYTVDTEPGNMEGPTYDAIRQIIQSDPNVYTDLSRIPIKSPRKIVVPVIDSFDLNGRDTVTIVGFATFFLEDVVYTGGKTEIRGKFINTLGQGEIDEYGPDFGFYGIKLIE